MYDNSVGITHQLTGIISVCGSCSAVFEDKRGSCQLPWLQDIGLVCSHQVGNSLIWALFCAHPTWIAWLCQEICPTLGKTFTKYECSTHSVSQNKTLPIMSWMERPVKPETTNYLNYCFIISGWLAGDWASTEVLSGFWQEGHICRNSQPAAVGYFHCPKASTY